MLNKWNPFENILSQFDSHSKTPLHHFSVTLSNSTQFFIFLSNSIYHLPSPYFNSPFDFPFFLFFSPFSVNCSLFFLILHSLILSLMTIPYWQNIISYFFFVLSYVALSLLFSLSFSSHQILYSIPSLFILLLKYSFHSNKTILLTWNCQHPLFILKFFSLLNLLSTGFNIILQNKTQE